MKTKINRRDHLKTLKWILLLALIPASLASAQSIPIPDLCGTGRNTGCTGLQPIVSVDAHWKLATPYPTTPSSQPGPVTSPQTLIYGDAYVNPPNGAWLMPNGPTTLWITPQVTSSPGGNYVYQTTFTIPSGYDPATASISGWWSSDNEGIAAWLNSNTPLTGFPLPAAGPPGGFDAMTNFTITHGVAGATFQPGPNKLTFQLRNRGQGGIDNNPTATGLRVEFTQSSVVPCVQPPSSMVAWWPLDETSGSVVVDFAGVNTNNGSAIPGPIGPPSFPASVPAEVGTGLEFPAATVPNPGPLGYVEVPSDLEVNFGTSDFTIDAWIKPTDQNSIQPIVDKLDLNAPPNKGYAFFVQSGKLLLRIGPDNGSGLVGAVSTGSVTYGVWNHVAVTVRRSDPNFPNNPVVTFYINGVLGGSGPPPGPGMNPTNNINGATPLWIGGNSRLAGGGANVSLGDIVIDELEFFKRELGQQEIQNISNAGPGGKCKCVLAPSGGTLWLPFDETSGTTSANLYTGGNNGTQINNPTVTNGYVYHSLCFDGSTQYVTVPDYAAINPGAGNFSIDAWVKRDPASGNSPPRIIVDKRAAANAPGYSLAVSFGHLILQLNDGLFTNYSDTGVVPADNQWHFVAVTVNRTSTTGGQFYVDCNPTGMFDPTGRPNSLNNTGAFQVGASVVGGNSPWLGCIDEVEFFPRVLTPTEIQSICNAGRFGKCKPVPTVVSAVSRKVCNGTNYDIPLPLTCPSEGVECRSGGSSKDYTIVVTFNAAVDVTGTPQAEVICRTGANACVGTGGTCDQNGIVMIGNGGTTITVPLTKVDNAQNIKVRINGVNGTTDVTIPMGILIGDVNGSHSVNATDVSQTKVRVGQPVDATNFRSDVNANCAINSTDVAIVKSNSGVSIPDCCP